MQAREAPVQGPPLDAPPPPDVPFFLYLRIHGCLATSDNGRRFAGSFCSNWSRQEGAGTKRWSVRDGEAGTTAAARRATHADD